MEHDDVAAGVVVETRGELVDEQVLVGLERRLHRFLLHTIRLDHEGLDDHVEDDRQDDRRRDLDEGIEGARATPLLSLGQGAVVRRLLRYLGCGQSSPRGIVSSEGG